MEMESLAFFYKQLYPAQGVADLAAIGEELPRTRCPPWYRLLARRRWVRDMNRRIEMAKIYGWRSSKGNVRHHADLPRFVPAVALGAPPSIASP